MRTQTRLASTILSLMGGLAVLVFVAMPASANPGVAVGGSVSSGDADAINGSTGSGCAVAVDNSTASGGSCLRAAVAVPLPVPAAVAVTATPRAPAASPVSGPLALTGSDTGSMARTASLAVAVGGLLLVAAGRRRHQAPASTTT